MLFNASSVDPCEQEAPLRDAKIERLHVEIYVKVTEDGSDSDRIGRRAKCLFSQELAACALPYGIEVMPVTAKVLS